MADVSFYITDHSADRPDTGDPQKLRNLYAGIKAAGISSVRYDWRWNLIEPICGYPDGGQLIRYAEAANLMIEAGLEPPTIVLSSIPEWALELYRSDRGAFFQEWQWYLSWVFDALSVRTDVKIGHIQVLNELNNSIYTPVDSETVKAMFHYVSGECFRCERFRKTELIGSLLVGNFAKRLGTDVTEYIDKNLEEGPLYWSKVVALDYYPGVWHWDFDGRRENGKPFFLQLDLLERVARRLARVGKRYEIGEIGMPTNWTWRTHRSNERKQRYFFDKFFRSLKHLLNCLERDGIALPERIGIYEALDEPPRTFTGKLLRTLTPFPEHDFGIFHEDGSRKLVLQGNRHSDFGVSHLERLIRYINCRMP